MSKKKNTLKDLDEFLKQQAATLVTPTPLSEKVEDTPTPVAAASPIVETKALDTPTVVPPIASDAEVTLEKVLADLETLAKKENTSIRRKIYDLVLQAADAKQESVAEDKMLINTVLYLTNGSKWKDAIREYWRAKR